MIGEIIIECLSETCFSASEVREGSVDTEVASDDIGMPIVSGKTLHGLLRDTYLSARSCLDPGGGHGKTLLGNPRSITATDARLRIGDAYLSDVAGTDMRQYLRYLLYDKRYRRSPLPSRALRDAFLLVRTQTAEDRTSGAPLPQTLRTIRVLPRGTILRAPLQTTHDLQEEKILLDRLARLTRHVGISRNRGFGEVRLSVTWADTSLAPAHTPPPLPVAPCAGGIRFLHYRVTLTAPCLISGRDLDPNSRRTRPYLPGSTLRGAVAAALANHALTPGELEDILTLGKVRFLHAFPEAEGERALPTPVTCRRQKDARYADTDEDAASYDAALSLCTSDTTPDEEIFPAAPPAVQQQPLSVPFVTPGGAVPDVRLRSTTHQRRHRRSGATRKNRIETVFVYEALEAGQAFRGCITVPNNPAGDAIRLRLIDVLQKDALWLGRSQRSGYGGAPIFEVLPNADADYEARPLVGVLAPGQALQPGQKFLIRLTSDTLLRDSCTGQHDPAFLETAVRERFAGKAVVLGSSVQRTVVRGFNRLWGTELPAVPAAGAGSVVLLQVGNNNDEASVDNVPLGAEWLRDCQARPFGERTADGYGCFIVAEATEDFSLRDATPPVPPRPAGGTPEALQTAQRRLYRRRIRMLVATEALDTARNARDTSLPPANLLQRMREPLQNALLPWQEIYRAWFASNTAAQDRLRERALRPLEKAWLSEGLSLRDLLAGAAEEGWRPPLSGAAEERSRYRILLDETDATRIWEDVRAEPEIAVHYLQTLLSNLVRRAQRQKPREEKPVFQHE